MEFSELVQMHRNQYVSKLEEFYDCADGAKEVLVQRGSSQESELYSLYRFDILSKNEDGSFNVQEFNNDSYLDHPTFAFNHAGLEIQIDPVYWNGVELDIVDFNGEMNDIHKWLELWLVDEDETLKNGDLSGNIHSFIEPSVYDESISFSIDFGTASIDALLQLLEILKSNNATFVRIHSGEMLSNES